MRPSALLVLSVLILGSCKEGGGGTETGSGSSTTTGSTTAEMTTGGTTGGTTATPTGSGGASETGDTTGPGASSSAGASSGGTDAATTTGSTGSTGEGSTGSSTTGGGSALMLGIVGETIFANCMPIVPPDPVHATWTLFLDNSAGVAPTSATIEAASIVFDPNGVKDTHAISVTPTKFGPIAPGEVLMTMLAKEDTPGGLPGCSHCGEKVRFEFHWLVDGAPVDGAFEDTLLCAF